MTRLQRRDLWTALVVAVSVAGCTNARAQQGTSTDPFPQPIESRRDAVTVRVADYAALPQVNGQWPRMMLLSAEPGGPRLFVNTMQGPLFSLADEGRSVTEYLDIDAGRWGVRVQADGMERGFQSFAFHPQFNQPGSRGYGRFYTYTDTSNMAPTPDFTPAGAAGGTHDTVLLEWTAANPQAATYDGGPPRELQRIRQPFTNHNGGLLAFDPLAPPGSPDADLLYMSVADGGSGGDPYNLAQNLGSVFGKILRIDPLGTASTSRNYGVPATNPFAGRRDALGEVYAYGLRNPQRFAWDTATGRMFVADIGQNAVEKISAVTAGANLGWNRWEGSYRYIGPQVSLGGARGETGITYPVAEYGHGDPLLLGTTAAITGVVVYRGTRIPQLTNRLVFGDNPTGEIFFVNADTLPEGGQDAIRRVLLNDRGTVKTLRQVVRDTAFSHGRGMPVRVDLRFGTGPGDQLFLLNKQDGIVRTLLP